MAKRLEQGSEAEFVTRLMQVVRGVEHEPEPLDEFLADQGQTNFTATIETIPEKSSLVKVTPWLPNAGCLCQFSLEVPKKSISTVTPTGDKHFCCGKALRVVEIQFEEHAQISLTEVFGQLGEKLRAGGSEVDRPFVRPRG